MNDRKAPHLKAAAMLARASARNKQFAGSGVPIPSRGLQKHPATPGTVARQDIVVGGMTTRTGCPASEPKKSLNGHGGANVVRTPREFEGKPVRGA